MDRERGIFEVLELNVILIAEAWWKGEGLLQSLDFLFGAKDYVPAFGWVCNSKRYEGVGRDTQVISDSVGATCGFHDAS